ncbi:hypothetical protein E2C01_003224 [Portunus trituberculatus]|uniref:Uncharacterized protein n=1 Tax=Portunus trituberculatus TaxID=210409 RepID=A0A5B7CLU1_PORTR|nr:hypothetical protein [Portunus trituberculatus]
MNCPERDLQREVGVALLWRQWLPCGAEFCQAVFISELCASPPRSRSTKPPPPYPPSTATQVSHNLTG